MTPTEILKREVQHRIERIKLYKDHPNDWPEWLAAIVLPDLEKIEQESATVARSVEYHLEQVRYELARLEKLYS